jgi:uncharacterized protein
MRVLLDTNILISFLLTRSGHQSTVAQVIQAAVDAKFTLILPEEVVAELERKVSTNQYLTARITDDEVMRLIALLRVSGQSLPPLTGSAPSLVRDPKDNYLLAAAAIADADVLVTGDRDLLDIRALLKRPAIMTAPEFLQLLESIDGPQP